MKKILFALIAIFTLSINCQAMERNVTKYYETTYLYDVPITKEITENKYNSEDVVLFSSDMVQTEYKKVSVSIIDDLAKLNVVWKQEPRVKSFDILSMYIEGSGFIIGSISGTQLASTANGTKNYPYLASTKNTKLFSNGFGISMNLADAGNRFTLSIMAKVNDSAKGKKLVASYRHAVRNIILSTSQKYNLINGNIKFPTNNLNSNYDSELSVDVTV